MKQEWQSGGFNLWTFNATASQYKKALEALSNQQEVRSQEGHDAKGND